MADKATKAPDTESKADKFVRLANARVGKALKAISNCQTLANKAAYDFDENQVTTIDAALKSAVSEVETSFTAALQGKKAKVATGFDLVKKGGE